MSYDVIIIDDSSTMRKILTNILRMSGLSIKKIYEADNGKTAFDIINNFKIDLVLSDINMPEMDGESIVNNMRQDSKLAEIPVIFVSSESSSSRIREYLQNGIGFIHKPFTPEIVRETIIFTLKVLTTKRKLLQSSSEKKAIKAQLSEEQLFRIFVETLEALCYLFPSPEFNETNDTASFESGTITTFSGAFKGRQFITFYGDICKTLSAKMLEKEDNAEQEQNDAVKEFSHIVCRNTLPLLGDVESFFHSETNIYFDLKEFNNFSTEVCISQTEIPLLNGQAKLSILLEENL